MVATIEEGLEEGDEVVLNPRAMGDLFDLPELADLVNDEKDAARTSDSSQLPVSPPPQSGGM